jgi:hypothetical protein
MRPGESPQEPIGWLLLAVLFIVLFVFAIMVYGCSSTQDYPYWTKATDLKCDGVVYTGKMPFFDPTIGFNVCEDRKGNYYFPNGVVPSTTVVTGAAGSLMGQASQIGAMTGGFF